MPSLASAAVAASARGAHRPSTACARALSPDTTLSRSGIERVISAS